MYTRAKEIGRKVMVGVENNIDAACSRPDVVKYMAILVFGYNKKRQTSWLNDACL